MLEQQMAEVLAGQLTILQGHIQTEARLESKLDSKFESFGVQLHYQLSHQLVDLFKEQLSGIAMGKGKEPTETPILHTNVRSSSNSGIEPNRDRNEQGFLSPLPMNSMPDVHGHAVGKLKLDFPKFNGENPRLWLRKCLRYFDYNTMSDYDKLSIVAMNLEVKPQVCWTLLGPSPSWGCGLQVIIA